MKLTDVMGGINSTQILAKTMQSMDGKNGTAARHLLNLILPQVVPFNRPLGFKIKKLTLSESEVDIPFRRANKNHLGGLHACALATVGEYAAGILILRRGDPSQQRLILKTLNAEYLKQGRTDAVATVLWPEDDEQSPEEFRSNTEPQDIPLTTVIKAIDGTELARIHTLWQVKPWSSVRKA